MTLATWMTLACLVAGQAIPAPAPANFAGTWTMTSVVFDPKPSSSGGSAALPPSDLVVRQTATSLSIDRTAFGQVTTQTFTFDGAENTNKSGAQVLVTRSRWTGKTLVTEGKISQVTSAGYDEWTFKETRSLSATGVMVVETHNVGLDGKATSSTRQFTKRKP
jgi:hypothetical protein